jgi:hypothetical protein
MNDTKPGKPENLIPCKEWLRMTEEIGVAGDENETRYRIRRRKEHFESCPACQAEARTTGVDHTGAVRRILRDQWVTAKNGKRHLVQSATRTRVWYACGGSVHVMDLTDAPHTDVCIRCRAKSLRPASATRKEAIR